MYLIIKSKAKGVVGSLCLLAMICLQSVMGANPPGKLTLTANEKTPYVIALASDHTVQEKYAATELARFLKEVTGVEFPIVAPDKRGSRPVIAVGAGAALQAAPGLDLSGLGQDGLVIQSRGSNLILTGGPAATRGTLYAVFTFLEDVMGCHWWTPTASDIPRRPELIIPEIDHRFIPAFEYRDPYVFDIFAQPDWAMRNKCNGQRFSLDAIHGEGISYRGFVHTFETLVPPKEFFNDHPEWYSEIDGKRVSSAQLCLTNPELLAHCIQRVKALLQDAPPDTIVSVSQNDTRGNCQCAKCQEIDKEEGSPSGSMLRFVNAVADGIKDEFPRAAIDTLAYQYTRKPPALTKPRPNVIIRLCTIECSFSRPLDHEQNREFAKDLQGWTSICQRVYIWDYVTNFCHFMLPHPNLNVLGANLRFFAKSGVKGVFEQGAWKSFGGELNPLRSWLLAKLLWNPKADEQKLIHQFLVGYYGDAAPFLSKYLEILHESIEKKDDYFMTMGEPANAPYLTFDLLANAEELFKKAEAAVKESPELLQRVQLAHASVQYAVLSVWPSLRKDAEDKGKSWPFGTTPTPMLNSFMESCRLANVTALWEGGTTPEQFSEKFGANGGSSSKIALPAAFKEVSEKDWIDFQSDALPALSIGAWSDRVSDSAASSGKAIRMPSTHNQWAIQMTLPTFWMNGGEVIADEGETWTVYIVARVEKKGEGGGTAFACGIYEPENVVTGAKGRDLARNVVSLDAVRDDGYQTYKVGNVKLGPSLPYVWVAPTLNPENMEYFWIDRIFMVRESAAIEL